MHNDEPTLRDRLRREPLIREVGEAIATCKPPQVFGVHGDWGLGKTSFLHQVRWYLTGDNPQGLDAPEDSKKSNHGARIQAIWFDAWRYHAEAVPVVALLQEMRAQLSQQDSRALARKRLGTAALRGALLSLDELTKKIGFQYAKFEQAYHQSNAENLAATLPSESLRKSLQETIGLLLPGTGRRKGSEGESRLVVFVDDLDRCEPEAAYRLLEGLKVYLTLNNCVFVLGLNRKAVEGAIANRLAGGLTDEDARKDAQVRATSYLEKICQNVWHLPIVEAPSQLLCEFVNDGSVAPHQAKWLRDVVGERQCLPPNPRKIKGFANLVARLCLRQSNDLDRGVDEMRKLLVVAYVYQFHHDLFVLWQANPSLSIAIVRWCRGEATYDIFRDLVLPMDVEQEAHIARAELGGGTSLLAEMDDMSDDEIRFPDPSAANVFWIRAIVRDLPQYSGWDAFNSYLSERMP